VTALVGIDVGTSGVKALALTPEGEIVGRAEREYPLSIPRPGWAEQDPEDWWRATEAALADLDVEPASIGFSGQMTLVRSTSATGLRPRSSGTTSARLMRGEIEERVGLEWLIERRTGADRLTALKLSGCEITSPRPARLHILLGTRPAPPTGEGDRSGMSGTPFDVAAAGATRCWRRSSFRPSGCRPPTSARRSVQRATRLQERWVSASTVPARSRSSSAPPASSSPRCPNTGPTPKRGCTSSATPSPECGTRWA
jgi:hypothetical protein